MASVKNALNNKNLASPFGQNKNYCHDCQRQIKIIDKQIINGVALKYKNGEVDIFALKCNDCYEKNPSLANYQKCEVYSRVVGYIRPVQQWHTGKQQEFKERLEFKCGC